MTQAPSAHNSQAWKFSVSDGLIIVKLDEDRHLSVSDPTRRQAYLGLGCVAKNGVIVLRGLGYNVDVKILDRGDREAWLELHYRKGNIDAEMLRLSKFIAARRTDRREYDGVSLQPKERRLVPTLSHSAVVVLDSRESVEEVAKLTGLGSRRTLARRDFRKELSRWVRSDWTKRRDGMPGYAMGMPAPVSLLSSWLVRVAPIHKQEQANTAKQVRQASVIVVLVAQDDSPRQWIEVGQLMERIWIEATAAGLSVGALAAAVESGETIRHKLQQVTGDDRKPQMVLRLGHSVLEEKLRPTPRRNYIDCLESKV